MIRRRTPPTVQPSFAAGLLAAACVWAPAPLAPAQAQAVEAPPLAALFDAAPGDAELVWAVPSLRGFSDQIATFAAETGLERYVPELGNAFAALASEMRLPEGVNERGPLLVTVSGLAAAMEAGLDDDPANNRLEPTALFLLPVSDYAAFVSGLGGDPADPATRIRLNGEPCFARQVPGYAVIAEDADQATAYAAGQAGAAVIDAMGPHVAPWLKPGQSLIYVDVAAMAPALKAAAALGAVEMNREMRRNAPGQAALTAPLVSAYAGLINGLIDGTDKLALTLDLGAKGLGLTAGGRLNPGSEMANMLRPAGAQGPAVPLLNRLPSQPYLVAASADLSRIDTTTLGDALRRAVTDFKDAAQDAGPDAGGWPIEEAIDLYTDMMQVAADATAVGSVMYAPEAAAMMTGGFLNQLTLTQTPNPAAALDRQQGVMERMNDLKLPVPGAAGENEQMGFETTYTANALEIQGARVDQFQINAILPPALMQQFGPMAMVMGNAGSGGYLAAKDGHVLATTGTNPQLMTQGLGALDAEDGLGSDAQLTALRENQLPADLGMEAWISIRGLANTVNPFLLMFAPGGGQLNVPADLSPIAMGAAGDPEGLVLRLFVPTDLVRFGLDTFEQFVPQAAPAGPNDPATPQDRNRRAPRAL